MISSKAIDLLQSFDKEEFRNFGLFVRSPYFNREKVQVSFYDVIKKYYPLFTQKGFIKESVYAKIFPGKKYNDGVMRNILSATINLAEKFLSHNMHESELFRLELNTITELNKRKQSKLFEKKFRSIAEPFDKNLIYDDEFYDRQFMLANEMKKYNARQKSTLKAQEQGLTEISEYLTVSFMIKMLKIHIHIASTNKYMFNYDQDIILLKGIEEQITGDYEKYSKHKYLLYFFNMYMLIKTKDEKYYNEHHKQFKQYYYELKSIDIKDSYSVLANYCYLKINNGELKYLKNQFEIYKQNIETGYYKGERGFLSHILFINAVVTGLEAGENTWVRNFINKYGSELDSVNRDNTVIFCNAYYSFWNKDYSEALRLGSAVKTDDLSYKHQIKSLYLKIYYELNETEPFYSHIDNYKHFISSSHSADMQIRQQLSGYIAYAKKLYDLKLSPGVPETETAILKKEIIGDKSLVNKPWLLRKLEELKINI